MTTQTGYVMTLANSIIGVSLLAMPYCFKQCGLLLGILLLLASNIITRLACHFLVKSAVMCRRKNFEYVGYHAFGISGKLIVELGVIGFLMGTNVAYFVVMGDLAPAILSKLFYFENSNSLRTSVLLVTGILIILPLSMLRNIESLAIISTGTMFFYLMLVLKVLAESFPHLAAADWVGYVNIWRPEGILQCFPIFAMALSCQTQVFEILEVLPNPGLEKMNAVVKAALTLCTSLYIAVGFFGYVAYARQSFAGNVLLSFSSSTTSDLFQLGFVGSIALSFPIVVFPCRASLNSLLYNKGAQYQELSAATTYIPDLRFKILTGCIVSTGLVTGLFIPNIEFVLGFVGSTIGVAICIIFPSAAFISISGKNTTERLTAKCVLVLGAVVMVLGVYGNLSASVNEDLHHHPGDASPLLHSPLPPPSVIQQPNQLPPASPPPLAPANNKNLKIEKMEKKPVVESPAVVVDGIEKRREPPIPVEPVAPVVTAVHDLPVSSQHVLEKKEVNDGDAVDVAEPPAAKRPDTVHLDAIAKEEHQLKEDDKLEMKEEARQGEELLKKLKEHQEEQKQLLKEQQNILEEIKIRDGHPVTPKSVEVIHPNRFNENIEKIQEVIDDLKERKQVLEKTKGQKIAEDKIKNAKKKSNMLNVELADSAKEAVPILLKAIAPILNSSTASIADSVPSIKSLPEVIAGRDILSVVTSLPIEREKRDALPDESCIKTNEKTSPEKVEGKASQISGNIIKETEVLSSPRDSLDASVMKEHEAVPRVAPIKEETRRRKR